MSEERDAAIIRMDGEGLSYGQISRALNVTRNAISGVIYRERKRIERGTGVVQPTHKKGAGPRSVRETKNVPAKIIEAPLPAAFKLPANHVPVSLVELRDDQCHYPIDGGYCGLPVTERRKQYCKGHGGGMVQPGGPKKVNAWVPGDYVIYK